MLPPVDPHAPYVQELVAARDWAGLMRYWMAHQHGVALDAAIDLTQDRTQLAVFLTAVRENPFDPTREAAEELVAELTPKEQGTLYLLLLCPQLLLCELAGEFPIEEQDRLYRIGLESGEEASQVAQALGDTALHAFCRNLMARGYRERGDLEAARDSLREALAIGPELARLRPDVFRPDFATTLANLGNVQSALGDLEAARDSYREALAIRRELARLRPDVFRPHVAITLNNLGNVQRDLSDLEAARDSYREANALYNADAEPRPTAKLVERQRTWNNLGRLYLDDAPQLNWPDRYEARNAFRNALDCAEAFRGRFRDPAQRRRVQGEALHVYENLMNVNVDLWHLFNDRDALPEAVETAERCRARNLMEMLADESLIPANAPPDLIDEFRLQRRRLRDALQRLHSDEGRAATAVVDSVSGTRGLRALGGHDGVDMPAAAPQPKRPVIAASSFAEVQRHYDEALSRIRTQYDPDFDPDRPVVPVTLVQARDLLPTDLPTAFVLFCLTGERGYALVITHDDTLHVPLPDLNAAQAWELTDAWYRRYYSGDRAGWEAAVPDLLRPVSERAIQPVVAAIERLNLRRLILAPHKGLHVFPLHACMLPDGRYLADRFDEVGYVPSLSILHRCAQRPRPRPDRFVLIDNPTGDLAFTAVEAAGLSRLYPGAAVQRGAVADRSSVLRAGESAHIFHYSGHAAFDQSDPLRSALVLRDRNNPADWLTLRHVFTEMHLRNTSLAVLNGCESGMVRPEQVDEYFGLSSGFLFAGAACVVSTLWSVWDLSSALLSLRFHQSWRTGQTPLAALSEAQRWLRGLSGTAVRDELPQLLATLGADERRHIGVTVATQYADAERPFSSPVHWAPFTAAGLSYRAPA